jgi:hypothetical protein
VRGSTESQAQALSLSHGLQHKKNQSIVHNYNYRMGIRGGISSPDIEMGIKQHNEGEVMTLVTPSLLSKNEKTAQRGGISPRRC